MNREELFSIGDISRLFGLSAGTLRHYETLGLVSPEAVDAETGYRYYSVRQFEPLNTVRYLRMLDMPLTEIREFLDNRDIGVIREKLLHQLAETEKKQRELENIKRKIDRRIADLDDACGSDLDAVTFSVQPPCRMAITQRKMTIKSGLDLERPIRDIARLLPSEAVFLGKVGVGISAEKLNERRFGEYDCVFIMLDDEDGYGGEMLSLPECRCASVRYGGSHAEAPAYYARLMRFIDENGLSPVGFSREITLIDSGLTTDASKYVTEICVPVE